MNDTGKEKIISIFIFLILFLPPLIYSFEFTSFIYPKEIVLSVLLVLLLPFFVRSKEKNHIPIHLLSFFLLNTVLFITLLYTKVPQQTIIRSAELFLTFLVLLILANFAKDRIQKESMVNGVLLSGIFVAVTLIVQYFNLLPVLFPQFSFYKQLYSTFGNQNLAGSYIAIVLIWLIVYWDRILWREGLKYTGIFILGCGLILSNSRSSWLSIMIILIIYLTNRLREDEKNKKRYLYILGILIVIFVITFPYIYERLRGSFSELDMGFRVRLWVYDGSLRMFLSKPFFGVGFGNYYYYSPKFLAEALHSSYGNIHIRNEILTLHAHNDILELLCEAGILGLFFILLFYFSPLWLCENSYVWSVFILISLFNPILNSPPHLIASCLSLIIWEECQQKDGDKNIRGIYLGSSIKIVVCALIMICISFLTYALWLPDYKLRQAEKLFILGKDCEKQYQSLVESKYATYTMYTGYAQELMRKGDYINAYKVLLNTLNKSDGGDVYLLLGRCARKMGMYEESKKWYRECLYRFPENKEARENLFSIGEIK